MSDQRDMSSTSPRTDLTTRSLSDPTPDRPRHRVWLPALLFGATCLTTFALRLPLLGDTPGEWLDWFLYQPQLLIDPLAYAGSIMAILLAHEMGHFITARRRGVDQSLPYFIPAPTLFGTMGAVIVMRSQPRTRSDLFDVAVAGPLAGLALAVPLALWGLARSTPIDPTQLGGPGTLWFGNSLLFVLFEHLCSPAGDMVTLHPAAFAAWAGMLVTALNLIPAGQLDGGHVAYAVFGRRSQLVSIFVIAALFGLGLALGFGPGGRWENGLIWILWGSLLLAFGRGHPPVAIEAVPLDAKRRVLAGVMLLIFVLTFIPVPVQQL